MTQHALNRQDLHIPDGWVDRSMTAFSAPLEPNQVLAPNIVITRDNLIEQAPGQREAFASYFQRQLTEIAAKLPNVKTEQQQLDDKTAELLFTWESGHGSLRQHSVFFAEADNLVITYTATAAASDYAAAEESFNTILASLRHSLNQPDTE